MSLSDPFSASEYVQSGAVRLASYHMAPPAGMVSKGAILLVHGWPECALSWRAQMIALSAAGFDVVSYDLRGFGRSDAPHEISAYHISHMIGDVAAILDHYGFNDVMICGHDWGGIIVWHAARALEQRVKGVISICTPFVRRAPIDPIAIFKKRFGPEHYFVHFTERPGEADALFAAHPRELFRLLFRKIPKGASLNPRATHIPAQLQAHMEAGSPPLLGQILCDEDLEAMVASFVRSGFHGGLNLYRNSKANWEFAQDWPDVITQPVLMISAAQDLFLPPIMTEAMTLQRVPKLSRVTLEDCGHWVMWEQPDALNKVILEWLD